MSPGRGHDLKVVLFYDYSETYKRSRHNHKNKYKFQRESHNRFLMLLALTQNPEFQILKPAPKTTSRRAKTKVSYDTELEGSLA